MTPKFVLAESYVNPSDAAAARNFLDANGIAAVIENAALATNLWHMGNSLGGVKLLVDAADVDRARELLDAAADELKSRAMNGDDEWLCSSCGESIEANFDLCWKCGALRGPNSQPSPRIAKLAFEESDHHEPDDDLIDEEALDREPTAGEPAWDCPSCGRRVAIEEYRCWNCGTTAAGEANPFFARKIALAPPHVAELALSEAEIDATDVTAIRAWRSAVCGVLFIPLTLYSLWLLLELAFGDEPLSPFARRRFFWAAVFNLAAFLVVGVWLRGTAFR